MAERLSGPRSVWLRPKSAVFAVVGAMTLYVLYHNERFLIEPQNPIWRHYAEIAFWLVPHAIAGTSALFLAPLQFSERLRTRFTTAHHVVGRIYVFGALFLAPLGAYGQYLAERTAGAPREFTMLGVVDAAMLMTTTLVAYLFAIRRRITQHRQWMTRSYAVALVFFEGRLVGGLLGIDHNLNATMATIWACLALSLLFAELVNSFDDIRVNLRARPAVRRKPGEAPAYSA